MTRISLNIRVLFVIIFYFPLPGLDESMAGVGHMFHLQVDGCVHGGQDQTVLKVQTGCVHKVQQDGKTLGVHFGV